MNASVLVNKVAESGLITIDLSDFLPAENSVVPFDLKPFLFMELILKEKDFRQQLKDHPWQQYSGKHVAIFCSADAIIPSWAYMLLAVNLQPYVQSLQLADVEQLQKQILLSNIDAVNAEEYSGKRVVIKGCGDHSIPNEAYAAITAKLLPYAQSIMYGEPCSTVPVYKKKA